MRYIKMLTGTVPCSFLNTGKNLWVFDIRTRRMVGEPGLYPMRISKAFGIPRDIDAAFHDSVNDVAYFFKGEYVQV